MKSPLTLKISSLFGKMLNTREAAKELINNIDLSTAESVDLDFSDVEFMSRSFADQLFKEQVDLSGKLNLKMTISNANDEIRKIMGAVSRTQSKPNRYYEELPTYKFSNPEMLSDYLFAV